jgi:hypothetical protein
VGAEEKEQVGQALDNNRFSCGCLECTNCREAAVAFEGCPKHVRSCTCQQKRPVQVQSEKPRPSPYSYELAVWLLKNFDLLTRIQRVLTNTLTHTHAKGINFEQVAIICHEANRAYCATIGDNSQPAWTDAPDWQKKSALDGVAFHLHALYAGQKPSPSASHESWLKQKEADGWKYGPVKDPQKKEHPCFVPYNELPFEQRLKDYIFAAIVESVWKACDDNVAKVGATQQK